MSAVSSSVSSGIFNNFSLFLIRSRLAVHAAHFVSEVLNRLPINPDVTKERLCLCAVLRSASNLLLDPTDRTEWDTFAARCTSLFRLQSKLFTPTELAAIQELQDRINMYEAEERRYLERLNSAPAVPAATAAAATAAPATPARVAHVTPVRDNVKRVAPNAPHHQRIAHPAAHVSRPIRAPVFDISSDDKFARLLAAIDRVIAKTKGKQ